MTRHTLLEQHPDSRILYNGRYALVHWVPESPFNSEAKIDHIYGFNLSNEGSHTYRVNGNCNLVRWSAKMAPGIRTRLSLAQAIARKGIDPALRLVHLEKINQPCAAIPDPNSDCPHVWYFLPPRTQWPELFDECMDELQVDEGVVMDDEHDRDDLVAMADSDDDSVSD